MNDFWKELSTPVFVLAPMEDVTDTVFREIVLSCSSPGKIHIMFTEFVSVDGLCHPKGRDAVMHRLHVNDTEQKLLKNTNTRLVAQIWGNDPEKFNQASKLISELGGFDGIDINMGCPAAKIVKQGACSALIGQNQLVSEIIQATAEGSSLPVSVKTRTGIKQHITEEWISHLLSCNLSALTLHARTQKMMSEKPADWSHVKTAVEVRNKSNIPVKIIGNGDVSNYSHGIELIEYSGADGAMTGRGIFSDPWFFNPDVKTPSIKQKLSLLLKHVQLFENTWESSKNYNILKRFFKIYVHGFDGAAALRAQLMEIKTATEAITITSGYLKNSDFQE